MSCGPPALATVNVYEAFNECAGDRSAIVNVASMAAHMLPEEMIPAGKFPQALHDEDAFMADMPACEIPPEEMRSGIAYAISKSFVRWYWTSQSERFGSRGLRIVSVSPRLHRHRDGQAGSSGWRRCDGRRRRGPAMGSTRRDRGTVGLLHQRQGRLSHGSDILNDGGVVASMRDRARRAAGNS
jgi:NAD(P)-dependent dehydrogenase (short-subunit alcohol dehydrogenase family)